MENLLLYAILGILLGIVYSLRKIFVIERKIDRLEKVILKKNKK